MNLASPETAMPWLLLPSPSTGAISAMVCLVLASTTQTLFLVLLAPQVVLEFEKNHRSPALGFSTGLPVAGFTSETTIPRRSDQVLASRFGPGAGAPAATAGCAAAAGAPDCCTVTGVTAAPPGASAGVLGAVVAEQAASSSARIMSSGMLQGNMRTRFMVQPPCCIA